MQGGWQPPGGGFGQPPGGGYGQPPGGGGGYGQPPAGGGAGYGPAPGAQPYGQPPAPQGGFGAPPPGGQPGFAPPPLGGSPSAPPPAFGPPPLGGQPGGQPGFAPPPLGGQPGGQPGFAPPPLGGQPGGAPAFGPPPLGGAPAFGAQQGGGYEFGPADNAAIEKTAMRTLLWGYASIVAGLSWFALAGIQVSFSASESKQPMVLGFVSLAINVVIGALFIKCGKSLKMVVTTRGNDIQLMMNALQRLSSAFTLQIGLTVVLVAFNAIVGAYNALNALGLVGTPPG
ncbi:MAG TPA: hypothetical protein VFS43_01615 [Polyangiaceae bacterium]|nr:hypothetical protein [Polyangiaceae bacterium]